MARQNVCIPWFPSWAQAVGVIGDGTLGGGNTVYPYQPNIDVLGNIPGAVQAIATSGTIAISDPSVTGIRLSAAEAATGVILAAGTLDQQEITLFNESANTITFAAVGTSHVANGTTAAIATLTAMRLVWDAQYNSAAGAWFVIA